MDVPPRLRSRVFWTVTGLIALDSLLFTLVVPALPRLADRFGLSDTEVALLLAAFPIAQLVVVPAVIPLTDRFGRRPLLVAAAALLAAATLAFALAGHPALLMVARTLQGAAAGVTWTTGLAAIADVYPTRELGLRLGLAETSGGAAALVGPVVAGVGIDTLGIGWTFALASVVPALAILPVLAVPETRRPGMVRVPLRPALVRLGRLPRARAGALSLALVAAVIAVTEALLPLDLDARLGLSATAIGLVFTGGLVTSFAGAPFAGRWSDRHGRAAPILAGGLLMGGALPLLAIGPAWWVALAFTVAGLGIAAMAASSGPLLTEAVDEAGMAGMYGLSGGVTSMVFAAGAALGPVVAGAARAAVPFWAVALGGGIVCAVSGVLLARLVPTTASGPHAGMSESPPPPPSRRTT